MSWDYIISPEAAHFSQKNDLIEICVLLCCIVWSQMSCIHEKVTFIACISSYMCIHDTERIIFALGFKFGYMRMHLHRVPFPSIVYS